MESLTIKDLPEARELGSEEMQAVQGGVSYYVDGVYRGERNFELRLSPQGSPTWSVWPDGSRTPY